MPVHRCIQCNQPMNPVEAMVNPVCGKCVRKNHKAVINAKR